MQQLVLTVADFTLCKFYTQMPINTILTIALHRKHKLLTANTD